MRRPKPAFSAVDTIGKTVSLADLKGRHVVLEWVDPACPYVRKHYGAIDSKPSANPADIATAVHHVHVALAGPLAGKPVSTPSTRAYGCTVKYGSAC